MGREGNVTRGDQLRLAVVAAMGLCLASAICLRLVHIGTGEEFRSPEAKVTTGTGVAVGSSRHPDGISYVVEGGIPAALFPESTGQLRLIVRVVDQRLVEMDLTISTASGRTAVVSFETQDLPESEVGLLAPNSGEFVLTLSQTERLALGPGEIMNGVRLARPSARGYSLAGELFFPYSDTDIPVVSPELSALGAGVWERQLHLDEGDQLVARAEISGTSAPISGFGWRPASLSWLLWLCAPLRNPSMRLHDGDWQPS